MLTSQAAFFAYKICAQVSRAKTVEIPLAESFVFDLKILEDYIDTKWTPQHKLIFIPNPNNPTGAYIDKSVVDAFLKKYSQRTDLLIIFDEAYFEYVREPKRINALDYLRVYPNVAVMRTLSKAFGANERPRA